MLAPVQVLLKKARPHLEARTPDTGHRTPDSGRNAVSQAKKSRRTGRHF
jgi:hypothetical protein